MTTCIAVSERIRAEYLEMPGMNLTMDQVARLCGMERSACQTELDALVDAHFLTLTPDGTYVRRSDEVGRARRVANRSRAATIPTAIPAGRRRTDPVTHTSRTPEQAFGRDTRMKATGR
jgi:predicted HAD superfamily Cof-like phosphohydrolase